MIENDEREQFGLQVLRLIFFKIMLKQISIYKIYMKTTSLVDIFEIRLYATLVIKKYFEYKQFRNEMIGMSRHQV